jgi:predicted ATP-dependent endonuclease of OLD family
MEIILQKFQGDKKEVSDINLLFIEEPEAHTHPQLQYVFINNIKKLIEKREEENHSKLNLQLVVTTHSSHIIADCDFSDIKYMKKGLNQDVICKNFLDLKDDYESDKVAFKFIKQYLNLSRAELFFSDKVIFVEGETERILLPAMMQKIDDKNKTSEKKLLSQNISIIEVGANSQLFTKLLKFLSLGKVLIITDLDTAKTMDTEKGLRLKGIKAVDANNTTNNSIKAFFELENKDENNLAILKEKSFEEKEKDGIRICYQTEVNGYQASSFEDAFLSENFDFFKHNCKKFQKFGKALKNVKAISDIKMDYYDIANKFIDQKTAFAVAILYYNNQWKTPKYIKEGLEWLRE